MTLKPLVAGVALAAGMGAFTLGLGSGTAVAAPGFCPPNGQCQGPGNGGPGGPQGGPPQGGPQGGPGGPQGWPQAGPGGPGGPQGGPPPNYAGRPGNWGRPDDARWHGQAPPWGQGPAPWGAGGPPPPAHGPLPPPWGPPPAPFDYFGQRVTPVFDPGFNNWGFWFFGLWIPL
ncbi:MAG: chitin-binding protein [Mycobacterium sp.]|nr:chitin-binding protein [Mycobacterium sp.]